MNHLDMSNQLLLEELQTLESMLRTMKDRNPSEWMLNNVMSLLYSVKSRAFLAQKLAMADVVHFMQKVLIELPFHAALDLLLKAVALCIKSYQDSDTIEEIDELHASYEECIRTVFAPPAQASSMRR